MFNFLFGNTGSKIKGWARGLFWLDVIAGCIAGIVLASESKLYLLLIPLSIPAAWVSNILLYAFGDICENLQIIAQNSYAISETSKEISKSAKEKNSQPVVVQKEKEPDELPDL